MSPAKPKRILLVDDIELNCILTSAVLERAGFEVESVDSGRAALAAVETRSFDLILLDIEMPGLSGHEAAELLKRRENRATRFAALSFRTDPEARERSRQVGLDGHIGRPLPPADLVREVESILQLPPSIEDDPWDREIYKDFAGRIGVERMQTFLGRMLCQFDVVIDTLDRGEGDDVLHRLIHDVSSVGGMLGFVEVSNACRAMMASRATASDADARTILRTRTLQARERLQAYMSTLTPLAA